MLRSDTQLEDPKGVSDEVGSQKEHEKGIAPLLSESEPQEKRESERPKESKTPPPKPYMPPLPFPQRFVKAKLDSQFGKFLNMLKKLHVNVTFLDALSQTPLYVKFLKEILSKKRFDVHATVALMRVSLKRREKVRNQRSQRPFPLSLICPLSHSHKGLQKLSLILSLTSFLRC